MLVVERVIRKKSGYVVFVCACDCGHKSRVIGSNILKTRSCCRKGRRSHGMSKRPEYAVWEAIVQRCTNPKHKHYPLYGGRGIRLCRAWRRDFAVFFKAVGPRPAPVGGKRWTIERVDNSRGYMPGNVVWATDHRQHRNMRNNRWLVFRGERLTISDMARKYDISPSQLHKRLADGWSLRRALLTSTRAIGRKVWAAKHARQP